MTPATCPLCGRDASFIETHHPFRAKRFECGHCATFVIDASSEAYLANLPEVTYTERRRKLSDAARSAAPAGVLIIRAPLPGEVLPSNPLNGRNTLITYVG